MEALDSQFPFNFLLPDEDVGGPVALLHTFPASHLDAIVLQLPMVVAVNSLAKDQCLRAEAFWNASGPSILHAVELQYGDPSQLVCALRPRDDWHQKGVENAPASRERAELCFICSPLRAFLASL